MSSCKSTVLTLCLLLASGTAAQVHAEDALIAVATNFSTPMKRLHASFEQNGAHRIRVTTGSTGTLYAQILNGAPFDLFLAADQHRPASLVDRKYAVDGSRFTYAVGQLVLWSPDPDRIHDDGEELLRVGEFRALAIANPALAPYGSAARDALKALGLSEQLKGKIVMGQNVGQTLSLIATSNAELGLVARSQTLDKTGRSIGSHWQVPHHLYRPIRQDAVLLSHGSSNAAALAFLEYLKSDDARALIESMGYGPR